MEEASPAKPSVAELAGKFKGHALPESSTEETNPFRKNTVFSLQLHKHTDDERGEEKPAIVSPHLPKAKLKSSSFIEKLQANLTLTPTPLLTLSRSPEVKQQAMPICIISPCGSLSSGLQPPQASEDEGAIDFEQPAEGTIPLPNINKNRVRLSFKRRLPTRQHRKSVGEEPGQGSSSPSHPHSPDDNGDNGEAFSAPQLELQVNLKDCSDPAGQPQDGPCADMSKATGAPEDARVGQEPQPAVGGGPDTASTPDTMEVQQEERVQDDQSPEQMEGMEEGGEL